MLEKAVQSTGADVASTLRLLTEHGLLVAAAEHYDFRHAIVRESVVRGDVAQRTDGRPPGRRRGLRLSRRAVRQPGLAQLAHHLVAAEEYPAALPVVMSAADSARRVYAFAEARRQLSVAREVLWSRVEDPVGLSGLSSDELVRREAEMARWAGQPSAAVALLRAGLRRFHARGWTARVWSSSSARRCGPPATPPPPWRRANAVRQRSGTAARRAGASACAGARGPRAGADRDRSLRRGRAAPSTPSRWRASPAPPATRCRRASPLPPRLPVRAISTPGSPQLRQCLAEAVAADAFKAVVRCYGNLAFLHSAAGRLGEVLQIATEGAHTCRRFGPLLLVAPTFAENWVHALVATGRWDEAARTCPGAAAAVGGRGHGAGPAPPARPGRCGSR